jgi:serine/threonine protein kinase
MKLKQRLGEGGCGVVYLAEQQEPVRRPVALKIIRLGMDTQNVIARFEMERQSLAVMDHPNIARVLDAGATESGLPYFVMEVVQGVKITDYCDQNQLDIVHRWISSSASAKRSSTRTTKASSISTSNRRIFSSPCTTACRCPS